MRAIPYAYRAYIYFHLTTFR